MKLIIASPRLGKVGDEYTPIEGVNVEALIDGGFLVSTTEPKKSSKVKLEPTEEN
jgi:hypothetical protein